MIRSEFIAALKQVATERGIEIEDVIAALKNAMIAAYRKDYPLAEEEEEKIVVEIDKGTGEVTLTLDDKDITPPGFGRIAAQTAKQVILQGVREAEKLAVVEEFKAKIGRVIPAMLQRFEKNRWFVDVGRTVAIMPREEQVFSENYRPNMRLKVYIKEILQDEIHPDVIVSRTDPNLVKSLFELEVPELQNGAVVIKGIAREPGSRTKIAVSSTQEGVDPVGSMVGQRGVRVQAVTNELQGEKMDIILWSGLVTKYIINALSPARVSDVIIDDVRMVAKVEVAEDQLSLAIGKEGQNVRLASKLTGYKIDIVNENGSVLSSAHHATAVGGDTAATGSDLKDAGLSTHTINSLEKAGITTLAELKEAGLDKIKVIEGIGPKALTEIKPLLG